MCWPGGEALKILDELTSVKSAGHVWYSIAEIQANLGDVEHAFKITFTP